MLPICDITDIIHILKENVNNSVARSIAFSLYVKINLVNNIIFQAFFYI